MPERRWELLPHFILRSTGFPFEWLERLAFTETEAQLSALDDHERRIAQARVELITALRADPGAHSARLRRRCCERASHDQPIDVDEAIFSVLGADHAPRLSEWNALLEQLAEMEQHAREVFAQELRTRRAALRDLVRDEWFQEAVWLSSPQMLAHGLEPYLERWDAQRRPSEVRRLERQLVAYVQRVCAKNETTSFFGPINYGDFGCADGAPTPGPGAPKVQRRAAFIAYWGVAALASALAADSAVQPYLRPALSPLSQVDLEAGTALVGDAALVPLSPRACALLPLVDGATSAADLARAADMPVADALGELSTLARMHVLQIEPRPPVTELQPLAWLRGFVEALPAASARARWLTELRELESFQTRFCAASLVERKTLLAEIERRFEALTGMDPRRKSGELYADRLLVYEECVGGVSPLSLGPAALTELQTQLAPVLDLFAAHACAAQSALRVRGAELLARLAPDGGLPFLRLVAALRAADAPHVESESPWQAAVRELIARRPGASELALDDASLPPIDRAAMQREVLLTSPDVLVLADDAEALRRGEFQVIVGECHDTLMLWGWPLSLHPHGARLEQRAADLLRRARGSRVSLANVLASKRVKITPFEYPGPTIEVLASSQKPAHERIPVAHVTATVVDGRPVLRAPGQPPLNLYNGELPSAAHSLFGLPRVLPPGFGGGAHAPRLTLGKAIVQRERWQLPREAILPGRYPGTSFELMRDWHRARHRLGLPRYLFARVAGERKPVFVDSANYFLLELLEYLVRPGTEVVLSEMLPTPEQLWLRDESGAYCAELRLSAAFAEPEHSAHV